jgi:hypothetical protein
MLGEFFAASEAEIDDAVLEAGPGGRFETVEAKTVSSVSIATLGELIGVGTYDALFDMVDAGRLADDGESGIDVVPESLRDALASAADPAQIAGRWHETDEMRDWSAEEIRDVLANLVSLAQRARGTGAQLWFWWSL